MMPSPWSRFLMPLYSPASGGVSDAYFMLLGHPNYNCQFKGWVGIFTSLDIDFFDTYSLKIIFEDHSFILRC